VSPQLAERPKTLHMSYDRFVDAAIGCRVRVVDRSPASRASRFHSVFSRVGRLPTASPAVLLAYSMYRAPAASIYDLLCHMAGRLPGQGSLAVPGAVRQRHQSQVLPDGVSGPLRTESNHPVGALDITCYMPMADALGEE
jgi:hypothetical protein